LLIAQQPEGLARFAPGGSEFEGRERHDAPDLGPGTGAGSSKDERPRDAKKSPSGESCGGAGRTA
jgi:hypothetical protein